MGPLGVTSRTAVEAGHRHGADDGGDGLRSRADLRRGTEVAIVVDALNQMLELGRPNYTRIA